ncbi:MAG: hypothetical protein DMF53_18405 [Acidobacteria bacterium]|nr:MAG: hypothetical protein DMF53_18405 [Acidobacteriota bacterium]
MSQSAAALAPLPFELVYDDGEPLETEWHTLEYPFLRELIGQVMAEQGRIDFYTGGHMFVYYSVEQAREVSEEMRKGLPWRAFRGPDVFWVGGVDPDRERRVWIAWEEGGRLPDLIVELLSPSTAHKDRTEKRDLYARPMRTDASGASSSASPSESGTESSVSGWATGSASSIATAPWFPRGKRRNTSGPRPSASRPRRSANGLRRRASEPRPSASARRPRKPSWRACGPCSTSAARRLIEPQGPQGLQGQKSPASAPTICPCSL